MPAITVKNIPDDLYEHLKESAAANHRSLNREIIACIENAVGSRAFDPEAVLKQASRLRNKWRGPSVTDAQFTKAKRAGRP
jgi:plasmid stability protein